MNDDTMTEPTTETTPAAEEVAAAPTEDATPAPAPEAPPTFLRLYASSTIISVDLTEKDRAEKGDRLAELSIKKVRLEDEKRDKTSALNERIKGVKSDIDELAQALHKGTEDRSVPTEVRAMIGAQTIDTVRVLDDGTIVMCSSRPMTEEERRRHLQGELPIANPSPSAQGELEMPDAPPVEASAEGEDGEAAPEDDGINEALGLPAKWPAKWREGEWKVQGSDTALSSAGLHEVYLRTRSDGSTVDELAAQIDWLDRPRINRALAMLKRKGFAAKADDGRWLSTEPTEARAPEPEPGRVQADPESDVGPRPQRREPTDTGEKMIANAMGVSDTWAVPA